MGTSVRRDTLRWLVSELKTKFGIAINTGKLSSINDCVEAVYKVCYETARRELLTEIEDTNAKISVLSKIDWTKAWSKKYSVLATYQNKVDISKYALEIRNILDNLKLEYGYNKLDSMLVLKDILYHEWKDNK